MNKLLSEKIKQHFGQMVIYKDPVKTPSLFAGRNLPAFVKDFILKKHIDSDGNIDSKFNEIILDFCYS